MAGLALLLIAGVQTAFGQGAIASLYGQWSLDAKATLEAAEASGGDMEKAKSLQSLTMILEFGRDQKLQVVVQPSAGVDSGADQKGTWKVLDEKPGKLCLEFSAAEGGPEPQKVKVEFLDKDRFRLVASENDLVLVFRRVGGMP